MRIAEEPGNISASRGEISYRSGRMKSYSRLTNVECGDISNYSGES
jgi:hypothetical protein